MHTIRYSDQWDSCCQQIGLSIRRWDEVYAGVEWAVSENPEFFELAPGTRLRVVLTDDFVDAPALVIYFTVDDDAYCTMWWVELDPESGAETWDADAETADG